VHFGYDADDLPTCASLTTCNPAGADALTIARSPSNGFITSITLGNVIETFGYNDYGEPASQTSTYGATPLIALTYDSASFPRDALGRITRKSETVSGTTTHLDYIYDDQGRLMDVFRNGLAHEHFDYDDAGNRTLGYNAAAGTTHVGTYDDQDRLRTYGPWTYTYTPNGELSTKSGAGQTWTYGYDTLGNLLSVTLPSGTAITYLVDGQNRRVGKRVNGTLVKQWLYKDGLRPVAELNGSGAVVARFVYASDRSTPDFIVRGGNRYRVLTDQLGSPRMAVNVTNSSDVPFRAEYTAFGVQTMLSGTAADWMPFGFAGGVSDPETGLVRFGARDYDANVGRWTAKDPIRFEGAQENLYLYVGGDPVNQVDPLGLFAGTCVDDDCFWKCMDRQGTGAALAAVGLSAPAVSIPKVGRAASLSAAMGGSRWTSLASLGVHHAPWLGRLGPYARLGARRLNPIANLAAIGAGSYLATSALVCALDCGE
jgi:RHS repeat-associated protein